MNNYSIVILERLTLSNNSTHFFGASEVVVTKHHTIITKTCVVFVSHICFQSDWENHDQREDKITLLLWLSVRRGGWRREMR